MRAMALVCFTSAPLVILACGARTPLSLYVFEDASVIDAGADVVMARDAPPAPDAAIDDIPIGVASGFIHTCVLGKKGRVYCTGLNESGELGNGTTGGSSLTPAPVKGLTNVIQIAGGGSLTCAVTSSGDVWCWGNGAVGDGSMGIANSPRQVKISGVRTLGVSVGSTCAVKMDKTVWCWGDGSDGIPVPGSTTAALVPVQIANVSDAVSAAGGFFHMCILDSMGGMSCWGENFAYQLGVNGPMGYLPPQVPASFVSGVTQIAMMGDTTCAMFGGHVYCWGAASAGRIPGVSKDTAIPHLMTFANNASPKALWSSGASSYHGCAIMSDDTVQCWGDDGVGQVGNGAVSSDAPLTPVIGGFTATLVSVGNHTSCGIRNSHVWCWGGNADGELGLGTTTNPILTPTTMLGL